MSLLKSGKILNFRKLRQDFSAAILREGKMAFENGLVVSAKIISLSKNNIRLSSRVQGKHDNFYECEIEIDRHESDIIDSNCDCSYQYDCCHLAAVLNYLEKNFDAVIVAFSKENDLEQIDEVDEKDKTQLREAFKAAETKEIVRKGREMEKQLLDEYILSAKVLGASPFFRPLKQWSVDKAEIALILTGEPKRVDDDREQELTIALRLPYRSKPLNIPHVKLFVDSLRYFEPIHISGKTYFFGLDSFDEYGQLLVKMLIDFAQFHDTQHEKNLKLAAIKVDRLGTLLALASDLATGGTMKVTSDEKGTILPGFYLGSLEQPLYVARSRLRFRFELEYLKAHSPKIMLKPWMMLDAEATITVEQATLFDGTFPGLIYQHTYWRFEPKIQRHHLQALRAIRDLTIPEPLFGTFIENSLPELLHFAEVVNKEKLEQFVTFPFVGGLKAVCDIQYLNGELEATVHFLYDQLKIPSAFSQLNSDHLYKFVQTEGILARNLIEEQAILSDLFQDFYFSKEVGSYICKSEKKIVEFMTEVIPRNQQRVTFNCPENLLDQFIYDNSQFTLSLSESEKVDSYQVSLKVQGDLKGVSTDLLWDCITSRRAFIELQKKKSIKRNEKVAQVKLQKILVLDLERIGPIVQLLDEIGIAQLTDHSEDRPLWTLTSIQPDMFENLPITFKVSKRLLQIQEQMLGKGCLAPSPLPTEVQAELRSYQKEGVYWLERLRKMHLSGILADDMGLGKTLQAIAAITQYLSQCSDKKPTLVVCPTSLIYNWQEEFTKFNPHLKTLPIDGTPQQRRKLLENVQKADIVITSYTLLQKDIETYKQIAFGYAILDEAQHIKNRTTRNAKSVKMVQAAHRLILTGTPLENSLEDIWSLFDFLMPGLLSTFDRFIEKYIRNPNYATGKSLEVLRRKLGPFIFRRMKADVLDELPPVSHIVYHCHLSATQKELYRSYADSAREELSRLVSKEGFERIQIHVLATLTRLKQICCHPAIFAKEKAENGDSAKYDMLLELLQSLIESNHKTVIFSQYTRMLSIMRDELEQLGIRFSYLDGSSKNRMGIVKQFNEDPTISVFLVSLKAGGAGLNLVGADTVIHYDLWWNPAVENQATDRVHRLGQKSSVSSYKLITLGTIEEKILELQQRKQGLVKEIISCDEEAMAKLTWEEVLELLQT